MTGERFDLKTREDIVLRKNMRSFIISTFTLGLIYFGDLSAQTMVKADPANWTTHNSTATFEDGIIHLKNKGNGSALLWVNDISFYEGSVELAIRGKDVRGQSFVGVAFHGLDNTHYDAIYFRPFNFKSQEKEKKNRAVQYISAPDHVWHVLRNQFPGKYENAVQPVPDPNDWFEVKIEVDPPTIKVYVNESSEPTLVVEKISTRSEGKLGLWIDSQDGWFKNIKVMNK